MPRSYLHDDRELRESTSARPLFERDRGAAARRLLHHGAVGGRRRIPETTELLPAREACARLGVKPATLYTYVSRGLVRAVATGPRARLYVASDVDRLAVRAAARRGHAAVAGGALSFGEAVLDSAITSVDGGVLRHRGRPLEGLLAARTPFETVAELLWEAAPSPWPRGRPSPSRAGLAPLDRLVHALPRLGTQALDDEGPATARALVRDLAACLVEGPTEGSVAATLARAVGRPDAEPVLDAVLVACADHELNASTFAARIAASAGAGLVACVGSALYTFTGPRHGTSSERVVALLEACRARGVAAEVERRTRAGEALAGFGHPLYPDGDPRAAPLLELARTHLRPGPSAATLDLLFELCAHARTVGLHPTVDHGLLAVALALEAPPGTAPAWFALGRAAGWIAHVFEQRKSPALLRPRARYVGL